MKSCAQKFSCVLGGSLYIYRKIYSIHFIYALFYLFYIFYLFIYFLLIAYLVLLNVSSFFFVYSLILYSSCSLRLLFALSFFNYYQFYLSLSQQSDLACFRFWFCVWLFNVFSLHNISSLLELRFSSQINNILLIWLKEAFNMH